MMRYTYEKRTLNSVKYLYHCHMWDNGSNYFAQFSDGEDVGSGIGLGTLLIIYWGVWKKQREAMKGLRSITYEEQWL